MCGCYIHEKDYAQYDLYDSGVYSLEIINMVFVSQVSGLVENFHIGIHSHTINVINVDQGHSNVKHFSLKILHL